MQSTPHKGVVTEVPAVRQPWHQAVAEELLARIADGTYAVGDRLPTEGELCVTYNLARGTVRQALDRLQQLGMIERRAGAGTRVVASAPIGPYQPFAFSPSDIAALAATTRLLRPQLFDTVIDAHLARRIGARAGSRWHVLQGVRVRRDDPETPLCWSEHYTRGSVRTDPRKTAFSAESLKEFRVEQRVSAALLDDDMAEALDAEGGGPALVVTRGLSDRKGRLINVGIYTHPADRYEITTVVSPGR
jgi:DNA-binding GntR family transcriptional regulator